MTSTDQHRYSRDEVVAELTSFYKFLTKLYLPSSVVKTPPPEGWPEITAEYLAPLKKTEIVVDLIRHLPFIQRDECEEPYQVYWSTAAVDFAGNYVKRQISQPKPSLDGIEPPEENGRIPSHVLTFATPAEGIHGFYFNIDTERGTIVLCDFVYGPRQTKLSQASHRYHNHQPNWMLTDCKGCSQRTRSMEGACDIYRERIF